MTRQPPESEVQETPASNVERAVRGPDEPDGDQDHVHQRPDTEAPETEELADALLPVS
jgi:hypothetical protein